MYLLLDLCNLASTASILALRLGDFRPRSLGWFKAPLRPLRQWLVPVVATSPVLLYINWLAQQMQASRPPPGGGGTWAGDAGMHAAFNGCMVESAQLLSAYAALTCLHGGLVLRWQLQ